MPTSHASTIARALLLGALATSAVVPLHAQTVSTVFASTTVDKEPEPFNPSGTSFQTSRRFDLLSFRVAETGLYDLVNTNIGGWDHFFLLYQNAFDPSRPSENLLLWADAPAPLTFRNVSLAAGTTYCGVTTGWSSGTGAYTLGISGPSAATLAGDCRGVTPPTTGEPPVVPVPEPSSVMLLLAGASLLLVRARTPVR